MPALTTSGSPTLNGDSTCTIDTTGSDRVQCPQAQSLCDETQMWVACRLKMAWASGGTLPDASPGCFMWADAAFNDRIMLYFNTVNSAQMIRQNASGVGPAASASDTWAVNDLVTIIGKLTAAGAQISIKGAAFTAAADATVPDIAATSFDIGGLGTINVTDRQIVSPMLWFAMGTGVLTDADATTLQSVSEITFSTLPGAALMNMRWTCDDFNFELARTPPWADVRMGG